MQLASRLHHCWVAFVLLSSLNLVLGSSSAKLSPGMVFYHDVKPGPSLSQSGYNVSFDDRSFIIGGKRTLLLSGSVHYPRVMVGEWANIFKEMYADGLNTVQTYIYWNIHEVKRGQEYDFSGNKNWTLFVEKAAEAGLFVTLRIGPFVASEWDYGAIPYWVNRIPGMAVRSSNDPWKAEMRRFFIDIVNMARPYLASNGGPIILGQVENEYHWNDPDYISWCGSLVKEVDVGIPFLMCNGDSANNTINTCNGNDCTTYAEKHGKMYPGQPLAWTENEGWYQEWDKQPLTSHDNRTAEDMSNVVMKWIARGGSYHNYYMWYGGNNFGRWAGSCVANEYATGVNLQSDGLPNEPKKTHLQRLHHLLAKYADYLLDSPSQVNNKQKVLVYNTSTRTFVLATEQFAYLYQSGDKGVAFIENEANETVVVKFMEIEFTLPAYSSSLVDTSSGMEVYNSGKVDAEGLPTERIYSTLTDKFSWKAWPEDTLKLEGVLVYDYPVEQLYLTEDQTDYLFYQTSVVASTSELELLKVESRISNALVLYVDGKYQSASEICQHNLGPFNYTLEVTTSKGQTHVLTILSISLGINTHTEPGEYDLKGITGRVWLGSQDITEGHWLHRPMLQGELFQVYTTEGTKRVNWDSDWKKYAVQSLVWYQFTFNAPQVKEGYSLLLDLEGMDRGYMYLNGVNLGRYWLTKIGDVYVQRYYFIPQSLLKDTGNMLTLLEELRAPAPGNVKLVQSTVVVPA